MKYLLVYLCFSLIVFGCNNGGGSSIIEINYPSGGNASLQEAINNLANEGSINIEAGLYKEHIVIMDKIVHIQGNNKRSVIDGQGETCISIINSSGSTVSGISLVNCKDGISTDSTIIIRNNSFFNNSDGVDYEGGSGGLLENNIFHMNKDDAIDLDNDVSVTIYNNVISGSYDDGIEIRLQPYIGEQLKIVVKNNTIQSNNSNGIQLIDYEINTNRSFEIVGNTFIDSEFSEISYSDNQITLPSFNIGEIVESVIISNNTFYPSVYSFTGSGEKTVFKNNIIYSQTGGGMINTTNNFPVDENIFIQLNWP